MWGWYADSAVGKKIKRRLEDLERRAGSSSASPEQSHAELVTQTPPRLKPEAGIKRQKSRNEHVRQNQHTSPELPITQYSSLRDDRPGAFSRQFSRDISASPPPSFGYSYPLPEPIIHAPYPQHAPFHSLPAPFPDFPGQSLYLPPLPVTLPSMSACEPSLAKNENVFDDDDMLGQYNMGYSPLTGMDIPTSQSYQDSNIHVNHPEYNFHFQWFFHRYSFFSVPPRFLIGIFSCYTWHRTMTNGQFARHRHYHTHIHSNIREPGLHRWYSLQRRLQYQTPRDWLSDSNNWANESQFKVMVWALSGVL